MEQLGATTQTSTSDCVDNPTTNNSADTLRTTWVCITSLLIFTIGMLGNVTTIYIYTRSKKLRRNKVFELILSAFDVYALLVVLPTATFDVYRDDGLSNHTRYFISPCSHSYYITILCSTICRYVAVCHPFKFNSFFDIWRSRFVFIILAVCVVIFTRTFVLVEVLRVDGTSRAYFADLFILTCVSFTAITVLYIILVVRLTKHNSIAPKQSHIAVVGNPSGTTGENQVAGQNRTRRKHVVALKTFGAVFICFVASYVTLYIVGSDLVPIECGLLYFLNHICNPVIYFLFNQEFRQKVKELLKF